MLGICLAIDKDGDAEFSSLDSVKIASGVSITGSAHEITYSCWGTHLRLVSAPC